MYHSDHRCKIAPAGRPRDTSPRPPRLTLWPLVLALLLVVAIPARAGDHVAIYHIDVGQGDATLIVGPSGRTLLMDGGNRGKGNTRVVTLLRKLGIEELS